MPSLIIVIPTYDEAGNIAELLRQIAVVSSANRDFQITAAVVDDSSPDETGKIATSLIDEVASSTFSVRVETRAQKRGLGAAYIWAFGHYLTGPSAPDFVMQMDADLSHQPTYIHDMLREARLGADFVVASRYMVDGGTPDWSLKRRMLSTGGNLYARLFLGSKITDYTGAFTLFSADLLRRVDSGTISETGYGFQIVLKYRALKVARQVSQVPIVFVDRAAGESKIPKNTFIRNLLLVPRLRLNKSI